MKYFFEAGMGSDSPSPGSDLGQTSEAMKMLVEKV
mgnify:FL=1